MTTSFQGETKQYVKVYEIFQNTCQLNSTRNTNCHVLHSNRQLGHDGTSSNILLLLLSLLLIVVAIDIYVAEEEEEE